jgi:hypothetical protein
MASRELVYATMFGLSAIAGVSGGLGAAWGYNEHHAAQGRLRADEAWAHRKADILADEQANMGRFVLTISDACLRDLRPSGTDGPLANQADDIAHTKALNDDHCGGSTTIVDRFRDVSARLVSAQTELDRANANWDTDRDHAASLEGSVLDGARNGLYVAGVLMGTFVLGFVLAEVQVDT